MLTNKQKKYLRGEANALRPLFQIGKDGISDKQVISINDALKAKELVKIRLLQTSPLSAHEAALEISMRTKADVLQIVGHTITLYKKSEKEIYPLP